ncbi:MAG: hypothetical protein KF861_16110, partial [Planctomycetaceae bacterium]|nr:hypothetical protein [Planctomycetaceae bacterium]
KPLAARQDGETAVYRYSQTQVPGRYEIRFDVDSGESVAIPFQVARDAGESVLTSLTTEQQESLANASGMQFEQHVAGMLPAVKGGRREKPIWNTLLVALLVLLGGELVLATRAARRRATDAVLPTSWSEDLGIAPPLTADLSEGIRRP